MNDTTPSSADFLCPRCNAPLPEVRRSFPWCECGWNLPSDPVDELRGWQRMWGRLSRWLGQLQARRDAAWLRHESPQKRIGWRLLILLIFFFGSLVALIPVGLFACLAALGLLVWQVNACVALALLTSVVVLVVYFWVPRPTVRFVGRRHRPAPEIVHTGVPEAVVGVADRFGVSKPNMAVFTHLPTLGVTVRIVWSFPPHLERGVIVGLPVLATLSVSEFKALVGHALVCSDSFKAWLSRYIGRALRGFWNVVQPLSISFGSMAVGLLWFLLPFSLCMVVAVLLRTRAVDLAILGQGVQSMLEIIGIFVVPLIPVWLILGILLWLAALWYRRETLMADRIIAKAYGRNVLLRALSKLWAVQRTFDRQWAPMAREIRRTPEKANFFTQFRDRWANLPDDYKDRAFREVTTGFRSLLYFEPVFEDRAALLSDLPNRLADDRPASVLQPQITELGARMARDCFELD